jgi:hypothetical protein
MSTIVRGAAGARRCSVPIRDTFGVLPRYRRGGVDDAVGALRAALRIDQRGKHGKFTGCSDKILRIADWEYTLRGTCI